MKFQNLNNGLRSTQKKSLIFKLGNVDELDARAFKFAFLLTLFTIMSKDEWRTGASVSM